MKLLRTRLLRGLLGGALFLTTIAAPTVRAQEPAAPAAPAASTSKKNYVYQYFFVGLCVALGMAVMCRPAPRETQLVKEQRDNI
jgi:hypothetical protein